MFENFITNQDSWMNGSGPQAEIVFSSRIRLARNISGYPFPFQANKIQRSNILKKVKEAYPAIDILEGSIFADMSELSSLDRQFLLERHLISQEHLVVDEGKGVIISQDEKISFMINEEDHLRMQVIASGLNLKESWELLNDVDNILSKKLPFCFSYDLGFLTSCPTNVGTAMRASCMLHLPALVLTKRINKILELLARISFTTRGLFGEGTQALGDFFQISNQASLGLSEEELIDNLVGVVNQVKEQEIDARNILLRKYKIKLEDSVWRALGILRSCRLIDSKEALSHLSILSLGLDLGIIKNTYFSSEGEIRKLINNLFILIQPAHLQKIESKSLDENKRDYVRAEVLREKLGG